MELFEPNVTYTIRASIFLQLFVEKVFEKKDLVNVWPVNLCNRQMLLFASVKQFFTSFTLFSARPQCDTCKKK